MLRSAPAGVGPGAYAAAAERVREASVTAAGVGRFSLRAQFAHNEPLQFGVEWGLPALGVMILGIFVLFARAQRQGLPGWWWLIAGLLLYGLTDFPLRVPACKLMAATAAGILTAGKIRTKAARRAGRSSDKSLAGPALAAAAGLLAGAACMRPAAGRWALEREHPEPKAALAAAARAQTATPLAAEPYLLRAQANWSFFESNRFSDPELEWRVRQALELAYSLSGHDPEIGMALGYFLLSTARSMADPARIERARATFLRAAAGAPTRPYPWLWTARTYMDEKNWAGALEALAQARRREPFFLEALAEMGRVEEARGNRAAARSHYRAALVLRAKLSQRKGMNPYEAALCRLDEEFIKGRLLDLGSGM